MIINYQNIVKHLQKNKASWKTLLSEFEEEIINARDNREGDKLPVYLTKWRLKSADSVYIKTKRKLDIANLEQIYDYAGLRVLCLFPQDIYSIHVFLIDLISKKGFKIKEMNIFNWDPYDPSGVKMANDTRVLFPDAKIFPDRKKSGYKSIHYIVDCLVGTATRSVEIQLRTILQDAWAELEHSLSYKKGNIHPHIRKSFSLLARDLETNDLLIAHLKEISQKESITEGITIRESGPHRYFLYPENMIPNKFKKPPCRDHYDAYYKYISKTEPSAVKANIQHARKLYTSLKDQCTGADVDNTAYKYFLHMEDAYLWFCENKYENALKIYTNLLDTFKDRYVLHFRIGEICFVTGNVVKALESFDQSQLLLSNIRGEVENMYRIKVKLANIFWLLGQEYANIALDQILEAERIFNRAEMALTFKERDRLSIINNVCWYQLEKWLFEKDKHDATQEDKATSKAQKARDGIIDAYNNVKAAFKKLEEGLDGKKEDLSSNDFDTAAWCCYNFYLEEKNPRYLETAKSFATEMIDNKKNFATFKRTSDDIHMSHYLTIMSTK